jgi:hypothetical protein
MVLLPTLFAAALASAPSSLAAMAWQKRVLLVSAQRADDPLLLRQRRLLEDWATGARERDLVLVEVIGDHVRGVDEPAAALRRRYSLPTTGFAVVLIGKDGGEAARGQADRRRHAAGGDRCHADASKRRALTQPSVPRAVPEPRPASSA